MAQNKSIHEEYTEIVVEMTNGDEFAVRSTYGKQRLRLDVDRLTHPAWTKQANYINTKDDKIARFNDKYSGIDFGFGE